MNSKLLTLLPALALLAGCVPPSDYEAGHVAQVCNQPLTAVRKHYWNDSLFGTNPVCTVEFRYGNDCPSGLGRNEQYPASICERIKYGMSYEEATNQ